MAVAPDVQQMRDAFTQNLMKQRQEAMRGVQDIYAQRGTTGSGEEAYGLGQTGYNFGVGMGQGEAALQQYLGNLGQQQYEFGQQFGEQQRQFNVGDAQWGQQFGEGQRQFDINRGLQEAQLTGYMPDQRQTLQGRQVGQDLIEQQQMQDFARAGGYQYGTPEMAFAAASPDLYQSMAGRTSLLGGGMPAMSLAQLQAQQQGNPFGMGAIIQEYRRRGLM